MLTQGAKGITPYEVFRLARTNAAARKRWEDYGIVLGITVANVMYTLDPEIIIIGGGISNAWNLFERSMKSEIKTHMKQFSPCPVKRSKLQDANLLGAYCLFSN